MNSSIEINRLAATSKNSKAKPITALICLLLFFAFAQNLWADFNTVGLATKEIADEFSKLSSLKGKRMVVVGFYNSLGAKDGFAPLFEDELQSDLIKTFPGKLIARNHIETVLRELKLSGQDIFADTNRKRFGKLLSAEIIISGSYRLENEKMIVNVQAIDVETGMALGAQRVDIKWDQKPKQSEMSIIKVKEKLELDIKRDQKPKQSQTPKNRKVKEYKVKEYEGPSWLERAWAAKWTTELNYKFGWEIGFELSPNYNVKAFHDTGSWILDYTYFYKWVYLSIGFGWWSGGDNYTDKGQYGGNIDKHATIYRFSLTPSLHIPFVNYADTLQGFGILGYRIEGIGYSFNNEYYSFGISGPFWGAKIRVIWSYGKSNNSYNYRNSDPDHVDFMGFDFSFENVILADKIGDDGMSNFQIYKIAFVVLYQ